MQTTKNLLLVKEMIGLLDYAYFKNYYKMILIDLSKQQALDVDPRSQVIVKVCECNSIE